MRSRIEEVSNVEDGVISMSGRRRLCGSSDEMLEIYRYPPYLPRLRENLCALLRAWGCSLG